MRRPPRAMALAAVVLVAALLGGSIGGGPAAAQTESGGRITGEVTLATEGATLSDDLTVDFIVLVGSEVEGNLVADVEDGAFTLEVPVDADRRYVPRAVYEGVSYLGQPVVVTEEEPELVAELPAVYETTAETPDLRIGETVLTAVALDRGTGELGLIREDFVLNPSDRVYVGGPGGVTLRLPAPEGAVEVLGQNADGEFALDGGLVTTTTPIRPEGSSIVTRYLVTYDIPEDEYLLRVTTPIPADRIVVRIPADYVRDLHIEGEGVDGGSESVNDSEGQPVELRTFVLEDAGPGDSLVVRLDGLAVQVNTNPLTQPPGSIIAGGIAVLVIGAAGAVAVVRGRPSEA